MVCQLEGAVVGILGLGTIGGLNLKSVVDVSNLLELLILNFRVNSLKVKLVNLSQTLGKGACLVLLKGTE